MSVNVVRKSFVTLVFLYAQHLGMDISDSPIGSNDRKATKNVIWSGEMEKVLIDGFVMQATEEFACVCCQCFKSRV